MADGADVRGTYYWTLMDNIEVRDADLLAAVLHYHDGCSHDGCSQPPCLQVLLAAAPWSAFLHALVPCINYSCACAASPRCVVCEFTCNPCYAAWLVCFFCCLQWHHGFNQHFGLYEWRPPGSGSGPGRPTNGDSLQLRQGSKALVALHAAWPETWQDVAAFARQRFAGPGAASVYSPAAYDVEQGLGAGDGSGQLPPVQVPGVPEQQQQLLRQELRAADAAGASQAGQQGGREVEEPLLGGRISDAV